MSEDFKTYISEIITFYKMTIKLIKIQIDLFCGRYYDDKYYR